MANFPDYARSADDISESQRERLQYSLESPTVNLTKPVYLRLYRYIATEGTQLRICSDVKAANCLFKSEPLVKGAKADKNRLWTETVLKLPAGSYKARSIAEIVEMFPAVHAGRLRRHAALQHRPGGAGPAGPVPGRPADAERVLIPNELTVLLVQAVHRAAPPLHLVHRVLVQPRLARLPHRSHRTRTAVERGHRVDDGRDGVATVGDVICNSFEAL